jgi:chemotaxis protein MotB
MDDDGGSSVPEWVVTFGDMMSLLLTFFIMLVSMSELKVEHRVQALLESIRESFGYTTGQAGAPGKSFQSAKPSFLPMAGRPGKPDENKGGNQDQAPDGPHVTVLRFREGTVHTIGGLVYFEPFQAEVRDEDKPNLDLIAAALAGKRNKVEIRGHTARVPLPPDCLYKTKWELSAARATAVMNYLVEKGIEEERLRMSESADTEPAVAARDEASHRFNHRVEVFMLDVFSEELVGKETPQSVSGAAPQ